MSYIFGKLNNPKEMIAPEYLAGKNTDIHDKVLKIMIKNYKKHQAENFQRGSKKVEARTTGGLDKISKFLKGLFRQK